MMDKSKIHLENKGENNGIFIGENHGEINMNISDIKKLPSIITTLIKRISDEISMEDDAENEICFIEFGTQEKLEYNNIKRYKYLIKYLSMYYSHCEKTLNILDDSNQGNKKKVLFKVHNLYLEVKGDFISKYSKSYEQEIEIIREKSDEIIECVIEKLKKDILSSNIPNEIKMEDIDGGLSCFTCYCFMKCKILEKPL